MGKPLFKSISHELRDPLTNIMAAIVGIKSSLGLKSDENPDGIDCLNYASNTRLALVLLASMEAEIDKMIIIDNAHADKAEKLN